MGAGPSGLETTGAFDGRARRRGHGEHDVQMERRINKGDNRAARQLDSTALAMQAVSSEGEAIHPPARPPHDAGAPPPSRCSRYASAMKPTYSSTAASASARVRIS